MQWMISHQDARRNLSPGELIYANSMVAEEIALENKKKKEKANEQFYGNRFTENKESVESTPIGVQSKSRSNTWTDSQTAKKAGVGIGTVFSAFYIGRVISFCENFKLNTYKKIES